MTLKTATWVHKDTWLKHTFYVELHNGYVIGEDSYLEWYKTQEVANKYYSERFQFYQDWGSEPENLLKDDSHGSAVAVYEYESNKKVPTKDALKVCCEDDAFEAMPYAWNAQNLVTNKGMTLKDSSESTKNKKLRNLYGICDIFPDHPSC